MKIEPSNLKSFREVNLKGRVTGFKKLDWLTARVPKRGLPLVVVNYSLDGKRQDLGLRLDLGKRVFLDSPDDPELSKAVATAAPEIIRVIGETNAPRRTLRLKRFSRLVSARHGARRI